MQFIAFIVIYPFLWCISILPFRMLYALSDGVYVLLYHVIGYRKKTVWQNLKLVFPEKSDTELRAISKRFYRHLSDLFMEMIKTLSISKKQLAKRFVVTNPEELKRLEAKNKSIILMYGHYASYEWSINVERYTTYKGVGIYKTLANRYFDKLVRKIRSKYNTELVDTKKAIAELVSYEENNIRILSAFLSDQSPRLNKAYYWTRFMNINVPCFTGAEMLAKKLDHTVAYLQITKVKRGHYEAEIVTLAEDPREYKDYDITEKFTRTLEAQIYKAPAYYLWTHKRWKHKDKTPSPLTK